MKRALTILAVLAMAAAVYAWSPQKTQYQVGLPGPTWQQACADTVVGIDADYLTNNGSLKTQYLMVTVYGGDILYALGGMKPTRADQYVDTLNGIVVDAGDGLVDIPAPGHSLLDSMWIRITGTRYDGDYICVEARTDTFAIEATYTADTLTSADTVRTPRFGNYVLENCSIPLLNYDWVKTFRATNADSGTNAEMTFNPGVY